MKSMTTESRFGGFGGRYVPETLIRALDELEEAYARAGDDDDFWTELNELLADYVGRPSPLYRARRLEAEIDAGPVYLKREDLNHTGAHKVNNTVGQALLARRMGKKRIIAETGAGQHGVATATACALFDMECVVYMGAEDVQRQALNVYRMELLGAEIRPVESGTRTLKDATNEAIRDWVTNVNDTHYIIGSVVGPAPFPRMVRDFQSVIGREAREQMLEEVGRLPGTVVACVGVQGRCGGATGRGGGGRRGSGEWATFGDPGRGCPRGPSRLAELPVAGWRRAGRTRSLGLGRPRLPGRGARALTPARQRAGRIRRRRR